MGRNVSFSLQRHSSKGHVRYILTWPGGFRIKIVHKFLSSLIFQKETWIQENNTRCRSLSLKPRSHVRIFKYRTWSISIELLFNMSVFNVKINVWLFPDLVDCSEPSIFSYFYLVVERENIVARIRVHMRGSPPPPSGLTAIDALKGHCHDKAHVRFWLAPIFF